MKLIYILLVLLAAAFISGCVDKNQGETPAVPDQTVSKTPVTSQTPASQTPSSLQTPPNGEDIFGTESDLAAMNSTFEDMNMEVSLLDSI